MNELLIKYCIKCDKWFPINTFPRCSKCVGGMYNYCKDCSNARNKAWRNQNRERRKEYLSQYRQGHLIEHRQYERKRDAQKRGTTIGKVDYSYILERDGYVCHICGEGVARSDLHFDHVVPLAKGGRHTEDNIKVTHARCNLSKHDSLPKEH